MRKSVFAITLIAVLSLVMAIFSGCKKDDNVVQPADEFAPPTALTTLPGNNSLMLSWTASSSHTSSDFSHYRISTYVGSSTTAFKTDSTNNATATSFNVTGLTNGTKYTFTVQSVKTNGALSQGVTTASGPCVQYSAIRIYEFQSTGASGISFSNGDRVAFKSSGPDNRGIIDLWIDGRSGAVPLLKSPSIQDINSTTGWRSTTFAQVATSAANASLSTYVAYPDPSAITSTSLTINPSNVYFAKTADGNYVRFTVSAVQDAAPNRYIDVEISYNETPGNAFAKR